MEWQIGNVKIANQIALAPMAGITTPAFIKLYEEMGIGYAVSELISAEAVVRKNAKTLKMLAGIEEMKIPVAVQIFGSDKFVMAAAAKILTETYPIKIIDINMGCPVPKVTIKNNAGSSLLKDPQKIKEIVKAVVEAVDIPVTVKIRIGWDENHINAPLVAKICEEAGASAIFVHGRTRSQGYSGTVNLDVIKDVVAKVSIPVIGNGDIKSCYDAKKMLDYTGCTAVMIGRGALGNPWLIKECLEYLKSGVVLPSVTMEEKLKMMNYHVSKVADGAILEMRSQLMYYLKGLPNTREVKLAICKATTKEELIKIIADYQKEVME